LLKRAKKDDCGLDLFHVGDEPIIVPPGVSVQVPAGVSVKIPAGHAGFIRPRSSTFSKRGLFIVEGVIDAGYTGPLFTHVWNPALNGQEKPQIIAPWEKLSQLIIVQTPILSFSTVQTLPPTERGSTGFGSTGA